MIQPLNALCFKHMFMIRLIWRLEKSFIKKSGKINIKKPAGQLPELFRLVHSDKFSFFGGISDNRALTQSDVQNHHNKKSDYNAQCADVGMLSQMSFGDKFLNHNVHHCSGRK